MKTKISTFLIILILLTGIVIAEQYTTTCELTNQQIQDGELTYFTRGSVTFTDSLGKKITAENVCMKNTHPNGVHTGLGLYPDILIVKNCNPDFEKDQNINTNTIDYSKAIIDTNYVCEYGCMSGTCVDRSKQKMEELYWNPYPQISPIINGVAYYSDPRIDAFYKDVDGIVTGMVPYADDASATEWCKIKDSQFVKGSATSYMLWNDYDPMAPVLKWNGKDWVSYQGNNLEYTNGYYCYTENYGKEPIVETIEPPKPGCPNKGIFIIDCDIKDDGYSYDLHWQMEGDIPNTANGHNNTDSDYYFNPRIYIDDVDNVPAHNTETATKWCQLLKHKKYISGESYTNWANPLTERKNWNGKDWDTIKNGDYPRYYLCKTNNTQVQTPSTETTTNPPIIIDNQNETEETQTQPIQQEIIQEKQECFGCLDNDKCYPAGFRVNGKYCEISNRILENQKEDKEFCENSFECSTNVCAGGKCMKQGLIEAILEFFENLGQGILSGWFLGTTN